MVDPEIEADIFNRAVEVPPSDRSEFLDRECQGQRELRESVEQLLQIHDTDNQFMETPVCCDEIDHLGESPGHQIGNYRLREQIGEGGFGFVWKADQLEPISREVAIKIVKLGIDSERTVERFELERQTLAILNHPNIAMVFDAGITNLGRPYFVMELVNGQPLNRYCSEQRLSLTKRLRLFINLCQAVHHAHQKGVVHRDLKPSNVLVAELDGTAILKVIDFGIAKVMHRDQAHDDQLAGTPDFMSPEQLERGCDVDTRADVFALGIILKRLVKSIDEPGADEVRAIAGKASRPDRQQRYPSASELAMDLERFLSGQPVVARAATPAYLAQKFFKRNRGVVVMAGLALLATLLGLATTTLGWRQAEKNRQLADHQAQIAQQQTTEAESQRALFEAKAQESRKIADFLKRFVNDSHPGNGKARPQQLDRLAAAIPSLADYPVVESEVNLTIAAAYHGMSLPVKAEKHYRRSLELRQANLPVTDHRIYESHCGLASCLLRLRELEEVEALIQVVLDRYDQVKPDSNYVYAMIILSNCRSQQEEHEQAYQLLQDALAVAKELPQGRRKQVSRILEFLPDSAMKLGKFEEAEAAARKSLKLQNERAPTKLFYIANRRSKLAGVLERRGKSQEALELVDQALEEYAQCVTDNDQHVIRTLILKSKLLRNIDGEIDRSILTAEQAVTLAETLPQRRLRMRGRAWLCLAKALQLQDLAKASEAWEKAIQLRKQDLGDHPMVASHLLSYATVLEKLGDDQQTRQQIDAAIDMLKALDKPMMLANAIERRKRLGQ